MTAPTPERVAEIREKHRPMDAPCADVCRGCGWTLPYCEVSVVLSALDESEREKVAALARADRLKGHWDDSVGNTNLGCLSRRLAQAEAALAEEPAPATEVSERPTHGPGPVQGEG